MRLSLVFLLAAISLLGVEARFPKRHDVSQAGQQKDGPTPNENGMKSMSADAKKLLDKLRAIAKDSSLSLEEKSRKLGELMKSMGQDMMKEFAANNISPPEPAAMMKVANLKRQANASANPKKRRATPRRQANSNRHPMFRGPGGYIGSIYGQLAAKQRKQLNSILVQRNRLTKKEMKQKINAFVGKLSEDLQKRFKAAKQKHHQKQAKEQETVKTMSTEAQKLYEDLKKVEKDGSITYRQEATKLRKIVKKADKKVLKEFREKNVGIPGQARKPKPDNKGDEKPQKPKEEKPNEENSPEKPKEDDAEEDKKNGDKNPTKPEDENEPDSPKKPEDSPDKNKDNDKEQPEKPKDEDLPAEELPEEDSNDQQQQPEKKEDPAEDEPSKKDDAKS